MQPSLVIGEESWSERGNYLVQGHTVNLTWGKRKGPHTGLLRDVILSDTLCMSSFGLG